MFSIRTSGSDINRSTRWANIVDIFISWSFPYNKVFMVFDQDSRILGSKETQLPKNALSGDVASLGCPKSRSRKLCLMTCFFDIYVALLNLATRILRSKLPASRADLPINILNAAVQLAVKA
jgi:hypothetical protein